jgi:hypothetical protein
MDLLVRKLVVTNFDGRIDGVRIEAGLIEFDIWIIGATFGEIVDTFEKILVVVLVQVGENVLIGDGFADGVLVNEEGRQVDF